MPVSGNGGSDAGVSIAAVLEPLRASRGLVLRVAPRWGGSALATDAFDRGAWRGDGMRRDRDWGLDASLGYRLPLRRLPGLLTPFVEATDAMGAWRTRGGLRYTALPGAAVCRIEAAFERAPHGGTGESRLVLRLEAAL